MLDSEALYFVRVDKLQDKFEGSYSQANVRLRPKIYKDWPKEVLSGYSRLRESDRRYYAVNCWHINQHESAAMWALYLKSDEGIAIQSTSERLLNCFANTEEAEDKVYIGLVNYIDYKKDWLPEGNIFYPFMHKRMSFAHGNELRAIIVEYPTKERKEGEEAYEVDLSKEIWSHGKYIPVKLPLLVENIFVAPTAPDWFFKLVEAVVCRFGLNVNPIQSTLGDDPVY